MSRPPRLLAAGTAVVGVAWGLSGRGERLQVDEYPCLDCQRRSVEVPDLDEAGERCCRFGPERRRAGYAAVHAVPMLLREQAMTLWIAQQTVPSSHLIEYDRLRNSRWVPSDRTCRC